MSVREIAQRYHTPRVLFPTFSITDKMREDWEVDDDDDDDDYTDTGVLEEEDIDLEMDLQDELDREADDDSTEEIDVLRAMAELSEQGRNTESTDFSATATLSILERLLSLQPLRSARVRTSGNRNARDLDEDEDAEDGGEDDDFYPGWYGRTRRRPRTWFEPVTEPQQAGVDLLMGGEFGRVQHKMDSRNGKHNIAKALLSRGRKLRRSYREDITSDLVPNTNGTAVASYSNNIYSGQFSVDSMFYYTCCQDFRLHIYDATAPPIKPQPRATNQAQFRRHRNVDIPDHESTMKAIKIINGHPGRWTITDSHLSPDNERIIYSSLTPTVYMATTTDSSTVQTPLRLADRQPSHWGYEDSFGIYSCRFSADGNEVIAGGSGMIFVYDLLADRRTVKIIAHADDVNSCCWADTASGNVLISASDDTFLKVWDRRSLGSSKRPSGVLIGHTEGITNVSAKGDGRYIISNGKDQALRLWDLRKMCTNTEYENVKDVSYGIQNYDYRYAHYPKPRVQAHPKDCSVMTYRGHAVLQTLIRCHFSPAETTGAQYIYSGSADGKIHIWSLDGRVVQVLDRSRTLPMTFDPSGPEPERTMGSRQTVCVRDEPVILSAGWESDRMGSSVARHEWKGLAKMAPGVLEDYLEKQKLEDTEHAQNQARICIIQMVTLPTFVTQDTMTATNALTVADNYGFPSGYFVIRSVPMDRLLDVAMDSIEDGTEVILWLEKEKSLVETLRSPDSNNQVFFIDTAGVLCSRDSGHAIDVENGRLVLRHRRPISQPYPNAYSHPLPHFHYSAETGEITVEFETDPAYPDPPTTGTIGQAWWNKSYHLTAMPMRKPRTFIDDASELLSSAIRLPLSLFSGGAPQPPSKADEQFDLREDELEEQDRGEDAEVDDSPELTRKVRVIATTDAEARELGEKARNRRCWLVSPLRRTAARTA
ncbi:hypothetical protein EW146_g7163 [Bondarzewia mesenterica]|uniref:Uncharacterized protein n=1 Tax=Bondarzewia mesenterica TaxID=1095465 RepID=A0A4S4LLJ5_9AGAM|nr:hypothetical protein EW146_g7163 [Bondarzewia mesenterica]